MWYKYGHVWIVYEINAENNTTNCFIFMFCKLLYWKIQFLFLINANDCVFENDNVRIKRKYGKFKRTVTVIDNKKG